MEKIVSGVIYIIEVMAVNKAVIVHKGIGIQVAGKSVNNSTTGHRRRTVANVYQDSYSVDCQVRIYLFCRLKCRHTFFVQLYTSWSLLSQIKAKLEII